MTLRDEYYGPGVRDEHWGDIEAFAAERRRRQVEVSGRPAGITTERGRTVARMGDGRYISIGEDDRGRLAVHYVNSRLLSSAKARSHGPSPYAKTIFVGGEGDLYRLIEEVDAGRRTFLDEDMRDLFEDAVDAHTGL